MLNSKQKKMKRFFFSLVAAIAVVGISAQNINTTGAVKFDASKIQKDDAIVKEEGVKLNLPDWNENILSTEMISAEESYERAMLRSAERKARLGANATTASVSDIMTNGGTLIMVQYYYWGGTYYEFEVEVRQDESDNTRYWFKNMVPLDFEDSKEVYATLSGNTLTFPAAQELGTYNGTTAYFVGVQSTYNDPITATVGENSIVFDDMGIGATSTPGGSSFYYITKFGGGIYSTLHSPLTYFALDYQLPDGSLYYGLSDQYYYLNTQYILVPGTTWTWNPLVNKNIDACNWYYYDENYAEYTSASASLVMQVNEGDMFVTPILYAAAGDTTTSFSKGYFSGDHSSGSVTQAGCASVAISGGGTFHPTGADVDYGFTYETATYNGSTIYLFGTGTEAVGAIFDVSDEQALNFTGVNIPVAVSGTFQGLKLEVRAYNYSSGSTISERIGEVFAQSETFTYTAVGTSLGILSFTNFTSGEDEYGFSTDLTEVRAEQDFALVLSGYYGTGVTFSPLHEEYQRPFGSTRSFIKLPDVDYYAVWTSYASTALHFYFVDAYFGESSSSSVQTVSANETKVFSTTDAFNFTYTDAFTSMDMYNMNGQKVATYTLPQTGTFVLPKTGLNDGVYLFRMNGKATEVLRAVK